MRSSENETNGIGGYDSVANDLVKTRFSESEADAEE